MKIRTSLVLACFVLSVVPLAVIVTYSYFTSRDALESAYQAEGARLTTQMDRRLSTIREELEQRLAETRRELFNLRFQAATGALENSARLRLAKREIARILTIRQEREASLERK